MMVEPDLLSRDVRTLMSDYDNTLYISIESLKELIVAYRNKGLWSKIWKSEEELIKSILEGNIQIIPLRPEHIVTYSKMTINEQQGHKDPSDHIIIAQAITERMPLVSSDTRFEFYRQQGLDFIYNKK